MQQAVGRAHAVQKGPQRGHDALFVQHPHVVHGDVRGCIRASSAGSTLRMPNMQMFSPGMGAGEGGKGSKTVQPVGIGHRRAVQVPDVGGGDGVKVVVRVQPDTNCAAALRGGMRSDPLDGAQGQRMIAPMMIGMPYGGRAFLWAWRRAPGRSSDRFRQVMTAGLAQRWSAQRVRRDIAAILDGGQGRQGRGQPAVR